MSLIDNLVLAKAKGVPIIGITTADQSAALATVLEIRKRLKGLEDCATFDWDAAAGVRVLEYQGTHPIMANTPLVEAAKDPVTLLTALAPQMLEGDMLVMRGANHVLDMTPVVYQAIANLRDQFKATQRTLILLAPVLHLPPELANDVLCEDQALPAREELEELVDRVVKDETLDIDETLRHKVVDAVQGLTLFAAEQILYLGVLDKQKSLSLPKIWERKKAFIRQTPGLSISDATHVFDDIGGNAWAKAYFRRELVGKRPPRVVCFIDEIEKALAGFAGDNTGVTQDQMTVLLTHMSKRKTQGAIFVGPPGASKTFFAEAVGNEAGIPTINMDFGAMKSSRVGDSEQAIRLGLKMMDAVADQDQLFLASCNGLNALPPELLRRFRMGIVFFDVPSREEQNQIWAVKLKRYGMSQEPHVLPDSQGWTGAQIEHCVDSAWRYDIPLAEAAKDVVPYAVTGAKQLAELRALAESSGFKSAVTGERYRLPKPGTSGRKTKEV